MTPENGFLLISKPRGITSSQLVQKIRKKFSFLKIGHTGTLDKSAEGLMILPFNKYTCFAERLLGSDKEYKVTIQLGIFTDSGDLDGEIIETMPDLDVEEIVNKKKSYILESILGIKSWTSQIPPKISALKKDGKRYSDLFRSNTVFEVRDRPIHIYSIDEIEINTSQISFKISVSSGTYIRKIVQDLSEKLKIPMVIASLVRTKIGRFLIENSQTLEELETKEKLRIFTLEEIYPLRSFEVEDHLVKKVANGNNLEIPDISEESEFFLVNKGKLLAWCQNIQEKNTYKYFKVF